jgi:PAS domain-containing protein
MARESFDTPEGLAARLRQLFPRVTVRERGLEGEPTVWYVYRDGRWVDDRGGEWWTDPRVPTTVTTLDGWIIEADPMARGLLGITADRPHHFTEFVAPGAMEDAESLFSLVAGGQPLTATVITAPRGSEPIAVDLRVELQGDRLIGRMRLAEDVDAAVTATPHAAASTPAGPPPPRVMTIPQDDPVFADYVAGALDRMPAPTPDGLALRVRRIYPHARVEALDDGWVVHRDPRDEREHDGWWTSPDLPRVRFDGDALIVEANEPMRELLGSEVVGHHWQEFILPGRTEQVTIVLAAIKQAKVAVSRFRMPVRDGELIEFDCYTEWDGERFTSVLRPLASTEV